MRLASSVKEHDWSIKLFSITAVSQVEEKIEARLTKLGFVGYRIETVSWEPAEITVISQEQMAWEVIVTGRAFVS